MVSATKLQNFMQSSPPQPNIQEIFYTFTDFFTNNKAAGVIETTGQRVFDSSKYRNFEISKY